VLKTRIWTRKAAANGTKCQEAGHEKRQKFANKRYNGERILVAQLLIMTMTTGKTTLLVESGMWEYGHGQGRSLT